MSLQPLSPTRRRELESDAGRHGVQLAETLAEQVHTAIEGYPAAADGVRSAVCQLTADRLIHAAAAEIDLPPDRLPGGDR